MNAVLKFFGSLLLASVTQAVALPVQMALGQIESGANQPERCAADFVRGPAGEISRYQLLPSVWHAYGGGDPTDPTNAWIRASLVIQDRCGTFARVVQRQPTPRELYALWTAPGQFARCGYDWQRLSPAVRDRSQRFANLVEIKGPDEPGLGRSTIPRAAINSSTGPGDSSRRTESESKAPAANR